MRRHDFITGIAGLAAAWPLAARAQRPAMAVIGFLSSVSAPVTSKRIASFGHGLSETGYAVGRDVTVEARMAEGEYDRLPAAWGETTAACGGLRSTPDCRPRRALLHLSYSCAPSYSDGARDTRPTPDIGAYLDGGMARGFVWWVASPLVSQRLPCAGGGSGCLRLRERIRASVPKTVRDFAGQVTRPPSQACCLKQQNIPRPRVTTGPVHWGNAAVVRAALNC
jgi:hypothetical protein